MASIFVLALQLSLYPAFARALGMGSLTGAIGATVWILAKPATFYGWDRVFHRLILVHDDLDLELAVPYNDCAQFAMQQNFNGCFQQSHPTGVRRRRKGFSNLVRPTITGCGLKEAIGWIKSHPRQFVRLTFFRFVAWWMPTETGTLRYTEYAGSGRIVERSFIYLMTLLTFPGLLILYLRDPESATVCICCLALFPIIYYFVQFQDRYRYPVMWLTFLLGSLPLSAHAERLFYAYAGSPIALSTPRTAPSDEKL